MARKHHDTFFDRPSPMFMLKKIIFFRLCCKKKKKSHINSKHTSAQRINEDRRKGRNESMTARLHCTSIISQIVIMYVRNENEQNGVKNYVSKNAMGDERHDDDVGHKTIFNQQT